MPITEQLAAAFACEAGATLDREAMTVTFTIEQLRKYSYAVACAALLDQVEASLASEPPTEH